MRKHNKKRHTNIAQRSQTSRENSAIGNKTDNEDNISH